MANLPAALLHQPADEGADRIGQAGVDLFFGNARRPVRARRRKRDHGGLARALLPPFVAGRIRPLSRSGVARPPTIASGAVQIPVRTHLTTNSGSPLTPHT